MHHNVLAQIDSLPPLPQTVLDIDAFKRKEDKSPPELAKIVGKDPLVFSSILKVANSAMFGFKKRIETPQMAVSLLGVNFTISLALASAIKNLVETSLEPYGASADAFLETAGMATVFAAKWSARVDPSLRDRIILPVFLLETGKFVIAKILKEQNLVTPFYAEILQSVDIPSVERKYIEASTAEVTAAIFKRWGLSDELIQDIQHVDNPEHPDNKSPQISRMIHVISTVCNIVKPLDETYAHVALGYAKTYGFATKDIEEIVEEMRANIS